MKPFSHVFRVNGDPFVYDVNSGDVFAVDEATVSVLEDSGSALAEGDLIEARRRVESARVEAGLFGIHRPSRVRPCPDCHGPEAYDGMVNQLSLAVSDQCNLRCGYCPHSNELDWVRSHRDVRMSAETARTAVRDFLHLSRHAKTPSISFYGGEPMLDLDLIREVVALVRREASRDDYRLVIDTNGTRLDSKSVDFIAEERLHLQVSLDGPPHVHDRHRRTRRGEPTHAAIMAGLARLYAADPGVHERIHYRVTLAPPTDPIEVGAWFADFPLHREAGIAEPPHVGAGMADLSGVEPGRLGLERDDYTEFRSRMSEARRRYVETCVDEGHEALDPLLRALFDDELITFYHRPRVRLGDEISPGGCCRPGQRRIHVRADGVYQPCERVGDGLEIGRAGEGLDFAAIERLWERFMSALGERCLECWACRMCPLCFTSLAQTWHTGDPRIPVEVCESARRGREMALKMWVELLRRKPSSLDFLKTSVVS